MSARTIRFVLLSLLLVGGCITSMHFAGLHAERNRLHIAAEQAHEQLSLYANSLQTLIDRYRTLPAILALDGELTQWLNQPLTPQLRQALNLKLEQINRTANSASLQVMDRNGMTIAASNWNLPSSYVGHQYGFRPYFTEAREHGTGRFYGVGVTTGIPGYFLSHSIEDTNGEFLGVIAVKLQFPEQEQAWSSSPHAFLVSDSLGIAFLTNRPAWRYRELTPIAEPIRKRLAQTRQYDQKPLVPTHLQVIRSLGEDGQVVRVQNDEIRGEYLWQQRRFDSEGWTLHLMQSTSGIPGNSRDASLAAGGAWIAVALLLLVVQQRWRIARLRRRDAEQLQRLVDARTQDLRTAQDSLVQAAKLAALGQMSAALAHEIKQPLTALQVHVGSLRLMLEDGDLDEARRAVPLYEELLERMASLAAHLKTYARQSPRGLQEPLALDDAIDKALQLLAPRLRDTDVDMSRQRNADAWVRGDAIRVEQILVNVLHNALDAMRDKDHPRLEITIYRTGTQWALAIQDSGGGIESQHLTRIFDPFFTTKPVGEGLGLGLAVSYAIAHDMGGALTVENKHDGACFTLLLNAYESSQELN
jgi:two-component system C4-dicarboxylate transport sensor histidine kinase DctB